MLWRIPDAKRSVSTTVARAKSAADHLGATHALIVALGDDLVAAKAFNSLPKAKFDLARHALAEATIACREGRFDAAVTELDKNEVKQLGGFMAALAQALKAWAVEKTTGRHLPIDRVLLFGESGPEGLKHAWPELSEFVARGSEGDGRLAGGDVHAV